MRPGSTSSQGAVAKRLCTGLQIRVGRFDSGPRLQIQKRPVRGAFSLMDALRGVPRFRTFGFPPPTFDYCGGSAARGTLRPSRATFRNDDREETMSMSLVY